MISVPYELENVEFGILAPLPEKSQKVHFNIGPNDVSWTHYSGLQ